MCNDKQLLLQVIFEGSAKDCRENTQKLNAMKAQQQYQVVLDLQNGFTSQTEETIAKVSAVFGFFPPAADNCRSCSPVLIPILAALPN